MQAGDRLEVPGGTNVRGWGSDHIAELLRAMDFPYIALTPGASFRGLHDSLVNYLGNEKPTMLLCLHEESAVSVAHGWSRITGKPLAVALHANVGLMHGTMAIFNAWCDRIPMVIIGATGPVDAVQRRPWVDWVHTSRDLGALVRGYTKWDDQPGSVAAALEALMRGYQIAMTPPHGPVFICLDAGMQEEKSRKIEDMPPLERFRVPSAADPSDEDVAKAAEALARARHPLILVGRVSPNMEDWNRRVALAERLNANVLTDLKTGASFPTTHRLHPHAPGLFVTNEAGQMVRDADVILSLDWVDLGGSIRQASGGKWPKASIIQCSPDQYVHTGWHADYQALPPTEISTLAQPDRLVRKLLDKLGPRPASAPSAPKAVAAPAPKVPSPESPLSVESMAEGITGALKSHKPCYIRLPIGWPSEYCSFEHPLDYIGYDGGGGLASGPGMAVGAALALRDQKSDRLPVAILGDGDFLMGVTAIWTAVHYAVPLMVIVANNQSFFNDELHQERVARHRQRPVENRAVGLRMSDPPLDLAKLGEGQGAVGIGPVTSKAELKKAIAEGVAQVKAGKAVVLDVRVAPEYARGLSSALLRHIPAEG